MRKALITGISGQDGSYLAEFLIEKGYTVQGIDNSFSCLDSVLKNRLSQIHEMDLCNYKQIRRVILEFCPDEIYHLAAYHFSSQHNENYTMSFEPFAAINILLTNEILETIADSLDHCRLFYASSCQVFGKTDICPQTEDTPFRPESMYSISKAAGSRLCALFRDHKNIFASVGILYNHESPRRSINFVTSQIAEAAAKASLGLPVSLRLKNMSALVDWGSAQDYVRAMWLILQQPKAGDFIVATGQPHSIKDFCKIAFSHVCLDFESFVKQESVEPNSSKGLPFIGNPSKIKTSCCWNPLITFEKIVESMVDAEVKKKLEILGENRNG